MSDIKLGCNDCAINTTDIRRLLPKIHTIRTKSTRQEWNRRRKNWKETKSAQCGDDNNTARNKNLVTFQFLFICPACPIRRYWREREREEKCQVSTLSRALLLVNVNRLPRQTHNMVWFTGKSADISIFDVDLEKHFIAYLIHSIKLCLFVGAGACVCLSLNRLWITW